MRVAHRQASREQVEPREVHSVSAQECNDYEKNLRKITSSELRRSFDEWNLRDTTSPTVPEAFSFENTSRRAAIRASMKPDDAHSPRAHFSISTEDMQDYEKNLRKAGSMVGESEKIAYLVRKSSHSFCILGVGHCIAPSSLDAGRKSNLSFLFPFRRSATPRGQRKHSRSASRRRKRGRIATRPHGRRPFPSPRKI